MFEETLVKGSTKLLALLGKSGLLKDAYLAGGTAVSLHLGHRFSDDLDFCTSKEFVPESFAAELARLGSFKVEQASKGRVVGVFDGVSFGLYIYRPPLLFPTHPYQDLSIADLRDIAAMKMNAIVTRGAKRDFIDLYFICERGHRLADIVEHYDTKYGTLASPRVHIKKSLTNCEHGEPDEMPPMLKQVTWEEVKDFFQCEVKIMN